MLSWKGMICHSRSKMKSWSCALAFIKLKHDINEKDIKIFGENHKGYKIMFLLCLQKSEIWWKNEETDFYTETNLKQTFQN